MCPDSRHDGHTIAANETRPIQPNAQFASFEWWRQHAIINHA
jgi:hypothetical protein